jgi:hypothetical protein
MTVAEKQKLASDIQKLPEEKMEQVVDIVREYLGPEDQDADIVLDVNAMDHKTLWELRRFVSNFLKSRTKWLRRMERREVRRSPLRLVDLRSYGPWLPLCQRIC